MLFIVLDDLGFGQLGCYGAPIRTPNRDALAAGGLRYANFHTTALCSPTRSCLLTGRNHHSNGMACITEGATGYPGSNGMIPFENGFLSEILVQRGYSTYAVGKWHLPGHEMSAAGPYVSWPLGRGFQRFYGFLGGDTHQYYPELVCDNHQVEPDKTPEEGYHLTEDMVDKAISFIADVKQVAPDKPFFLYFAPGAMHAPHHVPQEWADRYKGQFDDGWDAYREKVFSLMRLLICAGGTGGGVYPALAVLKALTEGQDRRPMTMDGEHGTGEISVLTSFVQRQPFEVLWVGGTGGMEADLVKREGFPFASIPAAGVHGVGLRTLPHNLWQIGRGLMMARQIIRRFRPEVMFFTGGYLVRCQ